MRHPPDPVGVVMAIRDNDPDVMERDELAEQLRRITELRAWCDAQQNRVVRRQRELAEAGRAEAPNHLLITCGGQSGREARAADERERVCDQLPQFEDALVGGSVSAGHVDAIAAATRGLDEPARAEFAAHADDLLADAERLGVDAFERCCRDLARLIAVAANTGGDVDELDRQRRASRVKRWIDRETGLRNTLISLDPVRDAQLWSAIEAARCSLRNSSDPTRVANLEQLHVEAVLAAVTGDHGSAGGVIVLIDLDTLAHGVHERGVGELADGTPLPVETVRQMACRADIIPVVLDGKGRALDVGRAKRLATEAQRQAIMAMYRTCVVPGCEVSVEQCEVHHVVPFEHGGPTGLGNMVPLCLTAGHHRLVHEGGWTLTIDDDRTITLVRPDGTVWFTGSTIDRAPAGVGAA